MACVAFKFSRRVSPSGFHGVCPLQVSFHGVCRLQVCFIGVCRLLKLLAVSPSKFVFSTVVIFTFVFVARDFNEVLTFMACAALYSASCCMVCVLSELCSS